FLKIGESIFLTTDGLIEEKLKNKDEIYGEKRVTNKLRKNYKFPASYIISDIKSDYNYLTNKFQGNDDITMFSIKRQAKIIDNFSITVKTDFEYIYSLQETIFHFLKPYYNHLHELWVGVFEALINAAEHGNQMDPEKNIKIEIIVKTNYIQITIKDEGKGFNWEKKLNDNYNTKQDDLKERGRGLMLIQKACDHIWHNEKGNKINLIFEV
ncbi:MAG: ATP-binding protein, partial [Nanoarchaeota archaeon]